MIFGDVRGARGTLRRFIRGGDAVIAFRWRAATFHPGQIPWPFCGLITAVMKRGYRFNAERIE